MTTNKPHRTEAVAVRAIETEFGQSFAEVIRGFREDGRTWATIAGALELPLVSLRRWCKRRGLLDKHRLYENPRGPLNARARRLGYVSASEMVREWRMNGKTRLEIAEALHCHPASLYWHTPDEIKNMQRLTEKQRAARRRNAQALNRKRSEATALRAMGWQLIGGYWRTIPRAK